MNQKSKNVIRTFISIAKTLSPIIVCVIVSWILLYGNSHVDSSNTYTVDCIVKSIRYDSPYRGRSTCVIETTTGDLYEIYSIFLQEGEADKLLEHDQNISLVVWDYPFVVGSPIKTIVDMRSDNTVYHTMDDQNEYSKKQRIGYWCTLIPLFSVFSVFLSCVSFYIAFSKKIKRYRNRVIKRRKKERKCVMRDNRSSP